MLWHGWPWHRVIILFTGLAFVLIGLQVILFHYRQNFRHWAMWLPVLAGPLLGVLGISIAFYNIALLRLLFVVIASVATIAGVFGFALHFAGVGERVDGYRMENFLVGPPVVLPLLITAMSILGLIAVYGRW